MPNKKRQQQVASEIKHMLGEYFIQEGKILLGNALVTVSRVEMSPDLQYANVYLSIYKSNENENSETIFHHIQDNKKKIRSYIAQNIHLRLIPEIRIFKDDSMEYADRINKILRDLGK
ncbi:MAG: 30S ribosome-binding factor RbfA [Candidatus Marinimicrobia bacterium]|nr:30S ribosome-binding factor RbfA [Candidatus Neomarinimicrobiota bacterium]